MKMTDEIRKQICDLKDRKIGIKKIADIVGCCPNTVTNQLRRAGREIIKCKRYKINQDFFETIDTEEKAYWLGFISADGCVTNRHLRIQLALKDEGHLEKFTKSINSNHPIQRNDRYCPVYDKIRFGNLLIIANKKLVSDLKDKGVIQNKSLVLEPYFVPTELERHYWRGFIDGDGCLKGDTNKRPTHRLELCGAEKIIQAFFEWCNKYIDSAALPYKRKNICGFTISKRQSVYDLLKLLYSDCSVFLERKKKRADAFLTDLGRLLQQQQ